MGTPLRRPQNAQNHKSEHLVRDSIWILIWVGPPPLGGYKNSELWPFHDGASSTMGHTGSPANLPDAYHHCSCLAWNPHLPLHLQTSLVTKISLGDPHSARFYHVRALCMCKLCVTLLAYWKVSPNKPGIVERLSMCEWLLSGTLPCSPQSDLSLDRWHLTQNSACKRRAKGGNGDSMAITLMHQLYTFTTRCVTWLPVE